MTAPLGERFDVPYHAVGPDGPPAVALVAGIHGNELNGVFVLSRLAAFLEGVAAGRQRAGTLRRPVALVPAVNVLGINTRSRPWPFDRTDINRMFPGYDLGETTQRIAQAVFDLTRPAEYRIDIHSSNLDLEELPQVRLYDATDAEREHAAWFGLPAVVERPANKVFTHTIGHAWRLLGGENYVIQAGQAGYLQHRHCEALFRALVGFLQRCGALEAPDLAEGETDTHHFRVGQGVPLVSDTAGMFVSTLRVGRWVLAGELLGHVYDSFTGRVLEEVRAPVGGLLTAVRRQPLLYQGDMIARIHTRRPRPEGADAHLHTQGQ
jgi:predicted deacylase